MAQRQQSGIRGATVQREAFLKDPKAVLERAETAGRVVVKNKDGSVHSVLSVPRDARPIPVK